jgi:hypothetical protein
MEASKQDPVPAEAVESTEDRDEENVPSSTSLPNERMLTLPHSAHLATVEGYVN